MWINFAELQTPFCSAFTFASGDSLSCRCLHIKIKWEEKEKKTKPTTVLFLLKCSLNGNFRKVFFNRECSDIFPGTLTGLACRCMGSDAEVICISKMETS